MRILIAEDNNDLRRLLYEQLTGEGYQVTAAADGLEAYERFKSETPDMALLDVMMPFMDGFSLLTKIRETSEIPVIPVDMIKFLLLTSCPFSSLMKTSTLRLLSAYSG